MPKLWSHSEGAHGCRVRVYERTPDGPLNISAHDPHVAGGTGGYRRESLGHRDTRLAMKEARRVSAALEAGHAAQGSPTLGYLIDLYTHHELPAKKPRTAKWLQQYLELWGTFVGRHTPAKDLGAREWEAFKRQRRSGAIDGHGKPVEAEKRKPMSPGTVNLGLDTLNILCNWATRWRVDGHPLLERSPVWRLPYMDDANPRRTVWTWDRFTKVLEAAEHVTMQVDWHGRRERHPSYLADILIIAEGTGRRIGAVRQLRYQDLRLSEGPHGKVQWPADTDKTGKAWLTPIAPDVRARFLKVLRDRPGLGSAPLFPSPRNPIVPVSEKGVTVWLRKSLERAGLPRLPHDAFHGLRRKWATERKHLPDVDVAMAGGWRSVNTMKRSYQQADEAGILQAVLDSRKLRDASPLRGVRD
jgi:integrase